MNNRRPMGGRVRIAGLETVDLILPQQTYQPCGASGTTETKGETEFTAVTIQDISLVGYQHILVVGGDNGAVHWMQDWHSFWKTMGVGIGGMILDPNGVGGSLGDHWSRCLHQSPKNLLVAKPDSMETKEIVSALSYQRVVYVPLKSCMDAPSFLFAMMSVLQEAKNYRWTLVVTNLAAFHDCLASLLSLITVHRNLSTVLVLPDPDDCAPGTLNTLKHMAHATIILPSNKEVGETIAYNWTLQTDDVRKLKPGWGLVSQSKDLF